MQHFFFTQSEYKKITLFEFVFFDELLLYGVKFFRVGKEQGSDII
ncbi:hypothetical protein [Rosenbergiella epipactidis]|nr:hypothetical protein [Rosenbergiella epipactidis]